MGDEADRSPRSVTRNDVARLAGVSTAVVSYVVNDGPRPVAPATRERVLDAIEKLGYQPNVAARTLITGKADLLALVVPDVHNQYFAALAQAVEAAARDRGLTLLLAQSSSIGLPAVVEALGGRLVVGIISATTPTPGELHHLRRISQPLVLFSLAIPMGPYPSLWPDYYQGTRAVVRHLVEVHGHTSIALVTGSELPEDRERAWRDVLLESGLDASAVLRSGWSMRAGRDAAESLIADHPEVTAVLVTSDQQATGLLSGLQLAGRRVPEDLAVVSFDGSPESEFTVPPLTTVAVPMGDMARDAVALALGDTVTSSTPYPTQLVVRRSCGCAVTPTGVA